METTKKLKDDHPIAKKKKEVMTMHGHIRIDDYYWMNQREDPEVLSYLNEENKYTDRMMKKTEVLQDKIYNEIIGRIKQTDMSVPNKEGSFYYFSRFEAGQEYPIYCREKEKPKTDMTMEIISSMERKETRPNEEVILNVNEMAKGFDYYNVSGIEVSPNENILAFGVDNVGRREYTLYFKNLLSGELLIENIPHTSGSVTWANDNKTVFYTIKDEALREYKIFKHVIGTAPSEDIEVFHEVDDTFSTYIYKTKSKKYLVIGSSSTLSTEYRYLNANFPDDEFLVFHPREKDHEYTIYHYKDKFYIRTNWEAKNFRLMETSEDKTGKDCWNEMISHRDDVLFEGIEIFKDYLVVEERINGLNAIRVRSWENGKEYFLDFPDKPYTSCVGYNPEYDTNMMRYIYSSLTEPTRIMSYDLKTRKERVLKQQVVQGGYNPSDYVSERLFATSGDGKKVPISIVYKKGLEMNGANPLVLYGYGSYGISMDPCFSSVRLSLLDRGFIWAIAHIRGGEDLGREWYEHGKLLKKKNTFIDFIECSKHMIDNKYTNSDKLFAMGGSAGGLLVGAVINAVPEMFKGVIAAVPFVDVVTTMLDESIPLTTGEYDEWGNPNDKEYYDYIHSYSPYDNVEAKDYPAMLVTSGLHDSQVQYYEPTKWVAKLRDLKTDDNLLLLHTNMDAGHGGKSGRFRQHKESALEFAFMFTLIGILD
ncbi:MAG TPA: S9 family peptidase [Flavobacteriales bacterium]|nr:S9 family peptidase [Flavobacteriales bacterium]